MVRRQDRSQASGSCPPTPELGHPGSQVNDVSDVLIGIDLGVFSQQVCQRGAVGISRNRIFEASPRLISIKREASWDLRSGALARNTCAASGMVRVGCGAIKLIDGRTLLLS